MAEIAQLEEVLAEAIWLAETRDRYEQVLGRPLGPEDKHPCPWSDISERGRVRYRLLARAAIATMDLMRNADNDPEEKGNG